MESNSRKGEFVQSTVLDRTSQLEPVTTPMAVSVLLPVIDETTSLEKTVEVLLAENPKTIHEILIVVCKKTTPEARAICQSLEQQYPGLVQVREQVRPFLGGAMRDAFEWAQGTHVLMMASDLETDPSTVKDLIATAASGFDIVTATRWTKTGGFEGYSPLKFVLNWTFQQLFRMLYGTRLSDLTYGFRIFKIQWVKSIAWQELRHPFLLETVLKPLRLGARIVEIPTVWRTRTEGISHNTFWQNFVYFRTALLTRFAMRNKLLREVQ
jgi:glycosyltransferase involved in cell wall biosynthesis